jgi:uncharacterized protein (TIGR00297 family)
MYTAVTVNYYPLLAILLVGMVLSVLLKKLTVLAAMLGGVCGWLVFVGSGYTGIAIMAAFFIIATLATGWKVNYKQQVKAAEEDKGRRKASQVLANAGIAALAGATANAFPQYSELWSLIIASAFSAAMADTLASELGTVYGKRFFNILTLKPDLRGLDGVISLEGTLIGIAGSALIAAIYTAGFGWNIHSVIIIIAGTAGNLTDSILGAGLERRGIIKNDAVNFLNTTAAALLAAGFYALMYKAV